MNKNWITVYSDASFFLEQKIASSGYWIKSDTVTKKGVFDFDNIKCPNHAELSGCYKAVRLALKLHEGQKIAGVLLRCDNSLVCDYMYPEAKDHRLEFYQDIQSHFKDLIKKYNCRFKTKHVKGHEHGYTRHSWVNNWCDESAKNRAKQRAFGPN